MTSIRTLVVPVLTAVALLAGALPPAAAAAGTAATGCATGWGSTPESTATQNSSPLVQIRTGQHACFDRVVFQIAGSVGAGWDVAYVDAVLADGSGELVPVAGGARLAVVLRHPSYDENGQPTYWAGVGHHVADLAGFRTLRSVVYAGSFEGYTTLGVGTRARLPIRVFALAGPGGDTRIVVDVAHQW
jgi:hypothetical protein